MIPPADRSRAYRDRRRGGAPRPPAPCGTHAAALRHRRRGEVVDELCLAAERIYFREWRLRRRGEATLDAGELEA